ncbi:hypothetical protein EI94DRAFT_1712126 [Lactarius quietus]|nr:hypothetical protein EI94DRAFT_1712126 [Lactarius quietus]
MQLNMWSRSQRQAVYDTVWAHCNAYGLRLSHPRSRPSFVNALDATNRADGLHESNLDENAWRNAVLDEVTEPVLMAYDYRELLAKASGRIIILSNFADSRCGGSVLRFDFSYTLDAGSPLALLSLTSRIATAESLANMLEFDGIRVSSIYFGPLAGSSITRSPDGLGNNRRFPRPFDWQKSLNTLAQKISRKFIVQDNLLLTVLRRVVQSRHPKFVYTVGLYPILHLALRSAPVGSRMVVTSLIRWAMSPERASE